MDTKKHTANSTSGNTKKITADPTNNTGNTKKITPSSSGNTKKITANSASIVEEKEPFLSETDLVLFVSVVVFVSIFLGIRYFQASPKKINVSVKTPKNPIPKGIDQEESEAEDDETDQPESETLEEGEHWIFYTEEISLKGDQIVCKNAKTDKYAVFFLKDCLGKVSLEDEFLKKNDWLEFPGKKLVLWKEEAFQKAVEDNASTEILYRINYSKYSGNVIEAENKDED